MAFDGSVTDPNNRDSTAPDPKFLQHLAGMLPSLAEGLRKKRIAGRGRPAKVQHPTKVCKICCVLHGHKFMEQAVPELKPEICEKCQKQLDEGHIAFVADRRYAFVMPRNNKMDDMKGKIVQLSGHVFDKLEKTFEITQSFKDASEEVKKKDAAEKLSSLPRICDGAFRAVPPGDEDSEEKGVFQAPDPSLLVKAEDGVLLTNQVGGHGCLHPKYKGHAYKASNTQQFGKMADAVSEYIRSEFGSWCIPLNSEIYKVLMGDESPDFDREYWHSRYVLSSKHADQIDVIFDTFGFGMIKVDRAKLGDSCEAWIHCIAGGLECVLTMWNSD